jgi:PKD repeat protein
MDIGCYPINVARWMFDGEPDDVVASVRRDPRFGTDVLTSAVLDFGDNSSLNLGTLSSPTNVPHTYSQPGTYSARLTGTDANGESSTSVQVVQVTAVTATVSATITSGRTVSGTATVSAPVTQYRWNWGDGTTPTTTTSATAPHTYAAAGTYDITVTATLQAGGTADASTSIVVP